MNNLDVINEIMAVLGFLIPSTVLWQIWNIKSSFDKTKADNEKTKQDVEWLKRRAEDEDLVDKLTK